MTDNERKKKLLDLKEQVKNLADALADARADLRAKDREIGLHIAEKVDMRETIERLSAALAHLKNENAEMRTALEVEVGISSQYRQKAYAYDRMMADRVADTIGV